MKACLSSRSSFYIIWRSCASHQTRLKTICYLPRWNKTKIWKLIFCFLSLFDYYENASQDDHGSIFCLLAWIVTHTKHTSSLSKSYLQHQYVAWKKLFEKDCKSHCREKIIPFGGNYHVQAAQKSTPGQKSSKFNHKMILAVDQRSNCHIPGLVSAI